MNQRPSGCAAGLNVGCGLIVTTLLLAAIFFGFSRICSGDVSESEYLAEVGSAAKLYNTARDVVDEIVRVSDSVTSVADGVIVAQRGVADLESAIQDMNDAYKELGNIDVPVKYRAHQSATLAAWRSGTEASVAFKLYLEKWLTSYVVDDSLVLEVNKMFAEEDRHQLEARRALQDARQ